MIEVQDTHSENLRRLMPKVGTLVKDFLNGRLLTNPVFHADDLRNYVERCIHASPGSPDRILRQLRLEKKIDYVLVSRRKSTYRVISVGEVKP